MLHPLFFVRFWRIRLSDIQSESDLQTRWHDCSRFAVEPFPFQEIPTAMKIFRPDRLLILILFLLPVVAVAQPDEPFEYPELDVGDELTYVGMGPGITPMAIFMDLDPLNAVSTELQLPEFEGPLLLWSGMLVVTPFQLQGGRIGGFGAIGYHKQSRDMILAATGDTVTRTLRFGVRFMAGLVAEYAWPVSRRLTILPGLVAGRGSAALELTQSHKGSELFGNVIDDSLFNVSGSDLRNPNRAARMLHTNWFVQPAVAVEYTLSGMMMLRASGGYHLGFGGDWEDEGGTLYQSVPDISLNAPFAQIGIFFGLFMQ